MRIARLRFARRLLFLTALIVPMSASAQQPPGLSLSFLQPTGTGSPTTSWDVWLRLTNPGSSAFQFDGFSPGTMFGIPGLVLPVFGNDGQNNFLPFAQYTQASLGGGYGCGIGLPNTFQGCLGGTFAYNFTFNVGGGVNPPPFIGPRDTFTLGAGQSFDYVIGTFSPIAGGAPAGTYSLSLSVVGLRIEGVDANGTLLFASAPSYLAQTCTPNVPGCEFTRTVVAGSVVPEPASFVLLAVGMVGLGLVARKRQHNA